jgi:hypothetical protein
MANTAAQRMSQARHEATGLTNSRLTRPCQRATSLSLMRGVRVWLTVRRNGTIGKTRRGCMPQSRCVGTAGLLLPQGYDPAFGERELRRQVTAKNFSLPAYDGSWARGPALERIFNPFRFQQEKTSRRRGVRRPLTDECAPGGRRSEQELDTEPASDHRYAFGAGGVELPESGAFWPLQIPPNTVLTGLVRVL